MQNAKSLLSAPPCAETLPILAWRDAHRRVMANEVFVAIEFSNGLRFFKGDARVFWIIERHIDFA